MKSGKGTLRMAVKSPVSHEKNTSSFQICSGKPAMQAAKYLCRQCAEQFDLLGDCRIKKLKCPRCSSLEIDDFIACKIVIGAPPWKFECHTCGCQFSIQSPSGPDEAKSIRCPVCAGKEVKWLALATQTCPSGG
jgi:DNA-directed RNA polymerase subunit RPC12/RpoP